MGENEPSTAGRPQNSDNSEPRFACPRRRDRVRRFFPLRPLPLSYRMRCFAMTHADTLALPPEALESKTAFYAHVVEVLLPLLSPSPPPTVDHVAGNWVTSLSNCSRYAKEEGPAEKGADRSQFALRELREL